MKAIFREVAEQVWQTNGSRNGRHCVVLGGTHGNELSGIQVIHQLLNACPSLDAGQLTIAFGNPKAIETNTRGSKEHADLNRCFTKSILEQRDPIEYEHHRAQTLSPYLQDADVMIDLHSTNKPSIPFIRIATEFTPQYAQLCRYFPCETILTDPKHIIAGEIALTDEYVNSYGGYGICYESGIAQDTASSTLITQHLVQLFSSKACGLFSSPSELQVPTVDNFTVYELEDVFCLTEDGFQWAQGRGTENFELFQVGEIIGTIGDRPFYAEKDYYLVFPKVEHLWKLHHPLGYLCSLKQS